MLMMNKVLKTSLGLAILGISFCLVAKAEDRSSGCGPAWGWLKKESLISSYSRNLTHSGSNTFSMTSGTSGCSKHSIIMNEKMQEYYAKSNHHALMVEMAQGEGEYLRTFAAVLGCDVESYGDFSNRMRENYLKIYPTFDQNPGSVLENVKAVIRSDSSLSSHCAPSVS